jgi:hypothetical protein
MIKIKLCAGWETSEKTTRRLLNQFKINNIDIEFVYDNSYDIIIFNNYVTEQVKEGCLSYIYFHEPSWSGNHQKNFSDQTIVCGYDKQKYSCNNFIGSFSHMFYGGRGSWCEGNDFWTYNNLIKQQFYQHKSKNISSIISGFGKENSEYPEGCIYKQRFNINQILYDNLPFIDFYGGLGNNLSLKKDGLIQYKFSLAIENSNEKGYISEKFYDPILTDTIPIYFGCSNVKELWSQNGYILLDNITDAKYIIDQITYINNNAEQLYQSMIKDTLSIKKQFLENTNLYTEIIKHIN